MFLLSVLILSNGLMAQNPEHDHTHDHNSNAHPKNEVGVGNYLSYLSGEQEIEYGLHLHYLRSFEESRFGMGIGYEQIFDEHKHRTLGIVGTYRPMAPLTLSLTPGILFASEESQGVRFVLHAEAVYEFDINNFHIGPALEFATSFEEYHLSIGLHMAFAF